MSDDLPALIPVSTASYTDETFSDICDGLEEQGIVDHAEDVDSFTVLVALDQAVEVTDYTLIEDA